MPRARILAALALLACAPPPSPHSGGGAAALRLVTWNVHDLFDEVDRLSPPGDQDTVPSPAAVEAKLARVGAVLRRLDADAVMLQEVENLPLLERLAQGPLAGLGYRAYLIEGRDPRGIDVGLLSRLPVEALRSHLDDRAADGGFLWARDLLEAHLGGAARPIVLLGAHLASRLDPAADARRAQQAARAREIMAAVQAETPGALVVLLGDLNDLPGSAPLAALLGDRALADLGATLPQEGAWTWWGGGAEERIDYALLAREDLTSVSGVAVGGGVDVAAASDHRPVVVDVWLDLTR